MEDKAHRQTSAEADPESREAVFGENQSTIERTFEEDESVDISIADSSGSRSNMPQAGNTRRPPAFQPGGQARVLFHGGPPMIVSIVGVRENRMITSWEYQLRDSAGAPVSGGAWIPQTRLVR